jgi:ubiquinone/menaquinone biosynthesis C-methylase UbiE
VKRSTIAPALLRGLRGARALRPVFFAVFGRSYAALWNSFAVSSGTAREAILAGVGADEKAFWESGQRDAERYIIPLVRPDSIVLDLGAGIGRLARAVAPRCQRIILVDVSGAMLSRARGALRGVQNADFVKVSGRSLAAIANESVDVAYSILVFQHVEREDVISYLQELGRILKVDGILRFQVPNLADRGQAAMYLRYALETSAKSIGRMRYYTREELEILLPLIGFRVETIETAEWLVVTARRTDCPQPGLGHSTHSRL